MKTKVTVLALFLLIGSGVADDGNPKIDYKEFEKLVSEARPYREKRRVSEQEFLKMAAHKETVVLDTRSRAKYEKLHVRGALHLNFSDFTEASLEKLIPDKNTRILIYCNNNFDNEPVHFASKRRPVALNIPTFLNLYAYGYRNVYELKPLLDINKTRIPFVGSAVTKSY